MPADGYANPQLLVTPASLHERIGPTGPLVIDLRPAEEFARGAIPGAVHLDLFGVSLIDTDPAPMRAFLWIIEHLLASRGVDGDRAVVVYDESSGIRAARAFWFLELFGHPNVRLLDGGFNAWAAEKRTISHEFAAPGRDRVARARARGGHHRHLARRPRAARPRRRRHRRHADAGRASRHAGPGARGGAIPGVDPCRVDAQPRRCRPLQAGGRAAGDVRAPRA